MTSKGNFILEALIAVTVFSIYSLIIFNMLMKNIFLSEELTYIKDNANIIENIRSISSEMDLKTTMQSRHELIYYIDKNGLNEETLFLAFDDYVLKEKPETDEYIKISLEEAEIQVEVYGEIYGRQVVMKSVV